MPVPGMEIKGTPIPLKNDADKRGFEFYQR
jgi:hypothetical protein